jgi:hypothetical protein
MGILLSSFDLVGTPVYGHGALRPLMRRLIVHVMRAKARIRPVTALIVVALCAAPAGAITGCGDGRETAADAEPDLAAEITQSRLDQSLGAVSVSVTNRGDAPVSVDRLRLHAPPFPDGTSEVEADLVPGQRVAFRVTYGEPDCMGTLPTPEAATAEVRIDGSSVAQIDVDDSDNALARLLTIRCGAQLLAEVADVEFGPNWTLTPDGSAVLGTVELSRVSPGHELVLRQVGGSVVYGLEPVQADEPVVTLGTDQAAATVPVRMTAIRCDPHALAEGRGKKNHVFRLWFTLDDDPTEIFVEIKAGADIQVLLDQLCPAP